MRKIILLIIVGLMVPALLVNSQNFSKEFGLVSKEEIDLKEYPLDRTAEAVVLFDLGKSHFVETDNSFNVVFEKTTRIKIFSEAGVKWAEVGIPFYQEGNIYERVYDIEAFTYNADNGKIAKIPFDPANTYNEKINDFWNVIKFALPNVKAGTIIEYRYKINSQYKFNFRDWEFQWKIPVIYSEYETKMIPFYEYTFILQGKNKFDLYETFEDKGLARQFGGSRGYDNNTYYDMVYKFGMKNIPAFNDEEYISSIEDYLIKVDFQLAKIHNLDGTEIEIITTWEDLIKELLKHEDFGRFISASEKLGSKLLATGELSQKTDNEKFNAVLDYVKENYNWNSQRDKYASKSPKKLIDDKFGNSADLNLFTIGLLNSAGIESYPVILSTRDHGKIKLDYPFEHFFNYVLILANIDGKMVLSDATEVLSLNDRIPARCINDKGLIIKKDKVDWIGTECLFTSEINTAFKISFDESTLKADLQKTGTEYYALSLRNEHNGKIENTKKAIDKKNYSLIDTTLHVQNYLDKAKPLKITYSVKAVPEVFDSKFYVSPFLNEIISENPLKQSDRKYPIDMIYPQMRVFNSTILIPKDFKVEYVPVDLKIDNELFLLNYSTKTNENQLEISFEYQFKKPLYKPEDYSKVKYYFSEIVKKGNEKIVLVKANSL